MPAVSTKSDTMTSILIRVPVTFKKSIERLARHESTTRYIVDAVEERMRLQKLHAWVKGYLEGDKTFHIKKVSRLWPTKRFYQTQK